jgi:Tol biopolymer transport system component
VETRVRELLRDLAEDMPSLHVPPADLQRRANRRIGLTVVGSFLALAVLALGAFAGIRALVRAERPTPANTGPTVQLPPTLSGPIAFARGPARPVGGQQVYLLRPDAAEVPLTSTADANNEPESWSPDGSRLVVQRNFAEGSQDLFLVSTDGSPEIRLTDDTAWDGEARFSPDGSMIAFAKGDSADPGGAALYVVSADGSGVRQLAAWSGSPTSLGFSWSPDGNRVVFAQGSNPNTLDDDIYVMDVDSTGTTRLTAGDHPGKSSCTRVLGGLLNCDRFEDPAWSPDGSRIAFVGVTLAPGGEDSDTEIYVMNADGSGLTPLSGDSKLATGCASPAWSPDGSKIVASCRSGVFVMNADGTGVTAVAPRSEDGASWSLDGSEIAVVLTDHYIYVVNPDGTGLTRITRGLGSEWGVPLWQPQGGG